jgi:hypothetical protein
VSSRGNPTGAEAPNADYGSDDRALRTIRRSRNASIARRLTGRVALRTYVTSGNGESEVSSSVSQVHLT